MSALQLGNVLSIVFLMIIVLFALLGSLKGLHKSIFQLVFSLFFLIMAVITIPYIAEGLMNVNLGFVKQFFPPEIQDQVTSIKETIPVWLSHTFPQQQTMFQPGSESLALIYSIVKLILILILFIVYGVLSVTILKFITFIAWIIVKPDKSKVKKRKLSGAIIGGARGVVAVILLAIPLVGLSSMFNSINMIMAQNSTSGGEQPENALEQYDFFQAYKHTWVSKAFGASKLDEKMFDFVFKIDIKVDGKKESVKIRNDLHHGAYIYDIIMKASEGKIDQTLLYKLSDDDISNIQKHLKQTTLLKSVQLVASEYVYDIIVTQQLDVDYETDITLSNLKKINLRGDIDKLLDVAKIINEVEFSGPIEQNLFLLNEEQATRSIDLLASVEWMRYLLPMGVNFLLNSDDLQQIITTYEIDQSSINKPKLDDLVEDFRHMKNVYLLLKDFNLNSMDDINNFMSAETLKNLSDAEVERAVDVIFGFELLNANMNLIAAYGHNLLESQPMVAGMITKEDFIAKLTQQEIKYITLLGKLVIENDAFGESIDFQALIKEENIDKLAKRMSHSELVSDLVPELLDMMFSNYATGITLEVPTDVSYKGAAGEQELKNLFTAVNDLMSYGMLNDSFDMTTLGDPEIKDISKTLSLSETIKHNISSIITSISESRSYNFVQPDYPRSHWSEDELYYTLTGFKIFEMNSISKDNINLLTVQDIETIARSITITDSVAHEIDLMNKPGGSLEDKLLIPADLVWYSTETEKGEFERLMLVINEVQGSQPLTSFDPKIDVLYGKNKDLIFESDVIASTFIEKHLKPLVNVTLTIYFEPKDYDGNEYVWYKQDSIDFVNALDDLNTAGIDYKVMDYNLFVTTLQSDPQKPREVNDALVQSKIFTHSMHKLLNELLNNQGGLGMTIYNGDPDYWGKPGQDGELLNILNTIGGH
ncbi:MAG: hypothetical protein WC939_02410 [Acholeplasmataceae bacterium]